MRVFSSLRSVKVMLAGGLTLLVLLGLASASASSANISHSYDSVQDIPKGSIVSLDPKNSEYVEAANTDNGSRLLGVIVATEDSLLAVNDDVTKVQVATGGTASVLVSTVGGTIKLGDQIAVSPFEGIGMKASPGSHVIGLAQTGFSDDSEEVQTQEVTTKNGKKSEIKVGYIRLTIAVSTAASSDSSEGSLTSLQRLAKGITGRTVSTLRVIISLIIIIVAVVALITLIYASIYGSIISIGRNPLAKYAVFRTLGSVIGMALLMAGIASLTIFFLLH